MQGCRKDRVGNSCAATPPRRLRRAVERVAESNRALAPRRSPIRNQVPTDRWFESHALAALADADVVFAYSSAFASEGDELLSVEVDQIRTIPRTRSSSQTDSEIADLTVQTSALSWVN